MNHGLPDELAKLYSLAGIRRNAEKMIEDATLKAVRAGYSIDRIHEILTTQKYPPPGADPQWLKGWEAAKNGESVPDDRAGESGFEHFLRRNG